MSYKVGDKFLNPLNEKVYEIVEIIEDYKEGVVVEMDFYGTNGNKTRSSSYWQIENNNEQFFKPIKEESK